MYLDNLELVMTGPRGEDAEAVGVWRDEVRDIWQALLRLQAASQDRLAVVASCRYKNRDLDLHILPLGRMTNDAVFRLMGWFGGLRRLAVPNRMELVRRVADHPRAVDYVDTLVREKLTRWAQRYGERAPATTEEDAEGVA